MRRLMTACARDCCVARSKEKHYIIYGCSSVRELATSSPVYADFTQSTNPYSPCLARGILRRAGTPVPLRARGDTAGNPCPSSARHPAGVPSSSLT